MTCLEAIYETKYDGFRCLAFSSGDKIDLQSKKQKSLNRARSCRGRRRAWLLEGAR